MNTKARLLFLVEIEYDHVAASLRRGDAILTSNLDPDPLKGVVRYVQRLVLTKRLRRHPQYKDHLRSERAEIAKQLSKWDHSLYHIGRGYAVEIGPLTCMRLTRITGYVRQSHSILVRRFGDELTPEEHASARKQVRTMFDQRPCYSFLSVGLLLWEAFFPGARMIKRFFAWIGIRDIICTDLWFQITSLTRSHFFDQRLPQHKRSMEMLDRYLDGEIPVPGELGLYLDFREFRGLA